MVTATNPEITVLLRRWQDGDASAFDEVVGWTYQRLLAMAAGIIGRAKLSTQPAALVSEAYLRLRSIRTVEWNGREHFFAIAANQFRRILIDQARSRATVKRGSLRRVPLSDDLSWIDLDSSQLLDLDRALDELQQIEPELIQLVELRYLMGCTVPEITEIRQVSGATVERHLRFAKAWLFKRLSGES